jgi:sugar transferase EpsL
VRSQAIKRVVDIVGASVGIILFAPVMLVVALLVLLTMGRPVLFRQQRPGLRGKPFTLYKFRTMRDARTPSGELLPDELRLTTFGKWLRSTSLDELPELFNVLKGDMSLVGPRPLLMEYLPRYSPEQARRHEVKPASPAGRRSTDAMR